jgi:antitoxin component HigA of HigAB toxin-antitoxin module
MVNAILTEADYDAALVELDKIFDADDDTPEGKRLMELADMIEAYEKVHYPIPPPTGWRRVQVWILVTKMCLMAWARRAFREE